MSTALKVDTGKEFSNFDFNHDKEISPGVYLERSTGLQYTYHLKTKNHSFIATAIDLHRLGIKNNKFMLRLYDRTLENVDPYAPFLSEEMIQRVCLECMRNIWYYLREVARISEPGAAIGPGKGSPYLLNRGNLAAAWCFIHNIDHYLVLPRQIGKTKSTLALINWTFLFSSGTKMLFLNKDGQAANQNLKDMKEQRDLLPLYMQQKVVVNKDGEKKKATGDNVTSLENVHNGNHIVAKAPARSAATADNVGRGATQAIQYIDEFEFIKYIYTIITAAGPAFNTAAEKAEKNNAPYCRIFTTTPGNIDSEPVSTTEKFRAGMMRFTESIYDCVDKQKIKDVISSNSELGIVYIEFSYTQLGKDDKWFRSVCQRVANDPVKIKREIFLQRIRGSTQSPFSQEDLEMINNVKQEPIYNLCILNLFMINIYEKLNPEIPYIVSVDCATGSGVDNTALTIIDPYTQRPVGEFKSPHIGPEQTKKMLIVLVSKYIPKAILAIERNHLGSAIIDGLKLSRISHNVYFDNSKIFSPDVDAKLDRNGYLVAQSNLNQFYGVYTSVKTRPIMFDILFSRVRDYKKDFVTQNIIDDLNNLVRTPTGKIAAASGKHDDSIMSYLIGMYVLFNGTNLERYGFHRGDKAKVHKEKEELTQEEIAEAFMTSIPEEAREQFRDWYDSINGKGSLTRQSELEEQRILARPKKQVIANGDVIVEEVVYDSEYDVVYEAEDDTETEDLFDFLNS